MEREYNQDNKPEKRNYQNRYQSPREILSDEDRITRELYEPLVRIIPSAISWDY